MLTSPLTSSASLPIPLTPLIGRAGEVKRVGALLERPEIRLITLLGPGGIGKTRLALEVAERLQHDWRDGAVFVALQSITDPELVASAIAQALGVRESGEQPLLESLRAILHHRNVLLILDNFEQVLPAAPLVTELLTACPQLTVLVTSRSVLRLYGEHDYVLPPLKLPDLEHLPSLAQLAESEAIRLFVERAQAANSTFELTVDNAADVAAICARVDSLPLAIELAAARTRMLFPAALLARLERRLTVLAGGPRDVPTRQRTMRDTIAWSYDLLPDDQQRLFRQLSVFTGGWTVDAAEAVCGSDASSHAGQALDVVDGLSELIDQSLVRQIIQPDGSTRYAMLETLREYGRDRLADHHEADAAFERHAAWFLAMAEVAARHLDAGDHVASLRQLADDQDNLRAALPWLYATGAAQRGLCMVGHLREFWFLRGHLSEGRAQAALFLDLPDAALPTPCRALALATAAWLAVWQGDEKGGEYAEQALAIWRNAEDETHVPLLLNILGTVADNIQGDMERAVLYDKRCLAAARAVGDTRNIARSLSNLGNQARRKGDYDRALALVDESMTVSRATGDTRTYALALGIVALIALETDDPDRAADLLQERLRLFVGLNDTWGIQRTMHLLAMTAVARKQPEAATRFLALVAALQERTGIVPGASDRPFLETARSELVGMLGEHAFQAVWGQARGLLLDDAIAEAVRAGTGSTVPTPAAPPPASPSHPLSARELDVLRGLVAGQSNAEIASALFISPNTVSNHVANIMNKLGLDSRTAVATWAVRHGVA